MNGREISARAGRWIVAGLVACASAALAQDAPAPEEGPPPPPAPALTGPETAAAVEWPTPPIRPAPSLEVRWAVRPPGAQLTVDGSPPAEGWDGALSPGQELLLAEEGAQLMMIWRLPADGYALHQLLEGPCRITVDQDGAPAVEGLGWAHLFRTLAEAVSPFTLSWETVDTGFESTEVARVVRKGEPWLVVVEGAVKVGERPLSLPAGRWAELSRHTRRTRRAPGDTLEQAVKTGTTGELTLLPTEAACPAQAPLPLLGAPLATEACFTEVAARDAQLAASRYQALVEERSPGAALAALGDVYLSAGLMAEAAHSYRAAAQREGGDPGRATRELGNARWALGEADGALAAFREAARLSPGDARSWYNRGLVAGALGEEAEAASALEKAAELDPGFGAAQLYLGRVQAAAGAWVAAAEALSAARGAGALTEVADLDRLTSALRQAGREAEAVELGRERVDSLPGDPRAWFDLARSLMEAGRQAEALRAYEKALQLEVDAVKAGER